MAAVNKGSGQARRFSAAQALEILFENNEDDDKSSAESFRISEETSGKSDKVKIKQNHGPLSHLIPPKYNSPLPL